MVPTEDVGDNEHFLGDFTPQAKIVEFADLTFLFCGTKYAVGKRFNTIAWLRFAEAMNTAQLRKTTSLREMGEFGALIRKVVVPEQTEDFLDAIEEADLEQDELMMLMNKILEATSARPTKRQLASSSGLPGTSANSTEPSSTDRAVITVPGNPGVV